MNIEIEKSWKKKLKNEFGKQYFLSLMNFLKSEEVSHNIFPPSKLIFNAFDVCSFEDVHLLVVFSVWFSNHEDVHTDWHAQWHRHMQTWCPPAPAALLAAGPGPVAPIKCFAEHRSRGLAYFGRFSPVFSLFTLQFENRNRHRYCRP
mgnify:CR=1 FL=1